MRTMDHHIRKQQRIIPSYKGIGFAASSWKKAFKQPILELAMKNLLAGSRRVTKFLN